MVQLFGQSWSRAELLERVGDISQLGGVRLVTFADGPEAGVLAADVRTGSGLNFTVLPGPWHGYRLRRVPRHAVVLAVVDR